MHCAPMCGGFVLGQVGDRMARIPAAHLCEWHRISGGILLPYHLGRLTTYAGLGATMGLGGALLGRVPYVSGVLLLAGAAVFLSLALRHALPGFGSFGRAPSWLTRLIGIASSASRGPAGFNTYVLGLCLGFLPCGLLYAALAVAASAGGAVTGACAMAAFGLGTMPALIAVGIIGTAAGHRWRQWVSTVAPAAMLLNAILLTVLAVRTLLPMS
jgi:sulfite exporter TauE/SafE